MIDKTPTPFFAGFALLVNMVFVMPKEFMAPNNEGGDSDVEEAMEQLTLELMHATFVNLEENKHRHLKPLFVKGQV